MLTNNRCTQNACPIPVRGGSRGSHRAPFFEGIQVVGTHGSTRGGGIRISRITFTVDSQKTDSRRELSDDTTFTPRTRHPFLGAESVEGKWSRRRLRRPQTSWSRPGACPGPSKGMRHQRHPHGYRPYKPSTTQHCPTTVRHVGRRKANR